MYHAGGLDSCIRYDTVLGGHVFVMGVLWCILQTVARCKGNLNPTYVSKPLYYDKCNIASATVFDHCTSTNLPSNTARLISVNVMVCMFCFSVSCPPTSLRELLIATSPLLLSFLFALELMVL